MMKTMARTKDPNPLAPFAPQGQLEWALIAPLDAATFESHLLRIGPRYAGDPDFDDTRSWQVLAGKKGYAALIETAPGSARTEVELARALSKDLRVTVYALGFTGYDDPDRGLPYIERHDDGKSGVVWMAPFVDDEGLGELATVKGPKGVPCDDPFAFAEAYGFDLRPYYELAR